MALTTALTSPETMKTPRDIVRIAAVVMCLGAASASVGAEKTIGVYVALADNASQGIAPVPSAIGNGEDPERNLYWGASEGLQGVFDSSKEWRFTRKQHDCESPDILRTRIYRHGKTGATLVAMAYRGAAIGRCIQDFEDAIRRQSFDLVAFLGHNGLMDFSLPMPAMPARATRTPDCVVLCCKSEAYFRSRIEAAGGRAVLLTTQLMYPGSFILHSVAEGWLRGGTLAELRGRAGEAYAANQRLSRRAGLGVFAKIVEPAPANTVREDEDRSETDSGH